MASPNTPVIVISGKKNSGKTTFVEKVIPELKKLGWVVATIKHHHHGDFEPDTKGKDSFRHYEAGAEGVLLASPSKIAYFEKGMGESPDIKNMLRFFPDTVNLVLVEGYHRCHYPHVEITRKDNTKTLLSDESTPLIALISDYEPALNVPVFGLDGQEKFAAFLSRFVKNDYELQVHFNTK